MTLRRTFAAALALATWALTGCGGSDSATTPAGSGTISGSVDGRAFDVVASSYFIGQSDDPSKTTVLYVFDGPVACADIGDPGWDEKIADKTASVELKLVGKSPAKFVVAATPGPAAGEASIFYTLSSTSGTPAETAANGGFVQLDTLKSEATASGSFDLTFPTGSLKGTFSASWCAGGNEP